MYFYVRLLSLVIAAWAYLSGNCLFSKIKMKNGGRCEIFVFLCRRRLVLHVLSYVSHFLSDAIYLTFTVWYSISRCWILWLLNFYCRCKFLIDTKRCQVSVNSKHNIPRCASWRWQCIRLTIELSYNHFLAIVQNVANPFIIRNIFNFEINMPVPRMLSWFIYRTLDRLK